ncbi:hypothetical protein APHAL10511_003867 [Amanita phalloides]|nr:hypothetical protein APHAL10511_003867 [Amanita phalloides]
MSPPHSSHTHHGHASDIAEANRQHFDNFASQVHQLPGIVELTQNCVREILKAYPFKEGETVAMDFACGTGLIARELVPHVKSILGVDISQGMLDEFERLTRDNNVLPEKMHAVRCDLEGKEGELDGTKFDVIFCASSYHHFESIDKVTSILAYFLKPGGTLIVLDFEKTEREFATDEVHRKMIPHTKGLDKAEIFRAFAHGNLEAASYQHAFKARVSDIPHSYFVAIGVKPQ